MNVETGNSLQQILKLSSDQLNISVTLFYISATITVLICNPLLRYVGPNIWLGGLAVGWGTIIMLMSTAKSFGAFAALRFVLGIFEAGVFPGVAFASTLWYNETERASRIALIWSASSLANAFGGAIAYGVSHLEGLLGKHAWQWLFILEGIPTILFGLTAMYWLPSSPENATFLTEQERLWAIRRLGTSSSRIQDKPDPGAAAREIFASTKSLYLWFQWIAFALIGSGFASLATFTPIIIKGLQQNSIRSQLLSVPPYALGFLLTIIFAPIADARNIRAFLAAIFSFCAAALFLTLALLPAAKHAQAYIVYVFAVGCFQLIAPLLIAWQMSNKRGTEAISAAIGNGFMLADAFQIQGAWTYRPSDGPLFHTGHYINFAFLLTSGISTLAARLLLVRFRERRVAELRDQKEGKTFLAL